MAEVLANDRLPSRVKTVAAGRKNQGHGVAAEKRSTGVPPVTGSKHGRDARAPFYSGRQPPGATKTPARKGLPEGRAVAGFTPWVGRKRFSADLDRIGPISSRHEAHEISQATRAGHPRESCGVPAGGA